MATFCRCADSYNAATPERARCLILCGNEIERKYVICRPCSLGNHTGRPCRQHVPEFPRHLIRTCKVCGYDSSIHEVGSDGQPN